VSLSGELDAVTEKAHVTILYPELKRLELHQAAPLSDVKWS